MSDAPLLERSSPAAPSPQPPREAEAATRALVEGITREVVSFSSGSEQLSAILTRPAAAGARPELAVVLSHGGSRGRMGAGFQYPYYARRLAERGIPSLRFDPSGIGDSTGRLGVYHLRDFHLSLEKGRWVDDTVAAAEWLRREVSPRKLVVGGVCAGALSSLGAGARSTEVDGVVVMGPPVLLSDDTATVEAGQKENVKSAVEAKEYLSERARKLLTLAPWKKLLSGESKAPQLARSILRGELARLINHLPRPARRRLRGFKRRHPRFNEFFLQSLDAVMKRERPVLFLYGSRDPFWLHFQEHFHTIFWDDEPAYERLCEIKPIEGSNPFYTLRAWQAQVVEAGADWMRRRVAGAR